jgi:hypothetical protein
MPLTDRHRCKRYLGIRPTVVVHDQLIDELLMSAEAMVLTFVAIAWGEVSIISGSAGVWSTIQSHRRGGTVIGTAGTAATVTLPDLETLPDYATRIQPLLAQDVVDTVAHLFKQRSPSASSETEGGGQAKPKAAA